MKCEAVKMRLSAYMDGELAAGLQEEVVDHLRQCPRCREELEELSAVDTLIRRLPPLRMSDDFARAVLAGVSDAVRCQPKKHLPHRAWAALLEYSEQFFEFLKPDARVCTLSLDEFDDLPASFIGYAYFKALGSKE